MSPKKAIIIVLILFFIAAIIFIVLYTNKPVADDGYGNGPVTTQEEIKNIEDRTNQQIEKIIEQGQTASGGLTPEAQKQIDDAVNQEIIEKMDLKTPEQIEADQKRRAELEAMEQAVNQQIRDQLENK